MVVYSPDGLPVWFTRTENHPGAVLVFETNGDVRILLGGQELWSSQTAH